MPVPCGWSGATYYLRANRVQIVGLPVARRENPWATATTSTDSCLPHMWFCCGAPYTTCGSTILRHGIAMQATLRHRVRFPRREMGFRRGDCTCGPAGGVPRPRPRQGTDGQLPRGPLQASSTKAAKPCTHGSPVWPLLVPELTAFRIRLLLFRLEAWLRSMVLRCC